MKRFPPMTKAMSGFSASGSASALLLIVCANFSGCAAGLNVAEPATTNQARYAKAKAVFEERCRTAGIAVKRTVSNVDGIELVKVRQRIPWGGKEYFDPMYAEAAMATEARGDSYLKQFLMSEIRVLERPLDRGSLTPPTYPRSPGLADPISGYSFVEYVAPADGHRQRCTLLLRQGQQSWDGTPLSCVPVKTSSARFALDYEDMIDQADRELWIAGTKLKIIDKQTGEEIAVLTKFVWDPGFGTSTSGRWPWQHAGYSARTVCPGHAERQQGHDSRYFIDEIIQPKQGN